MGLGAPRSRWVYDGDFGEYDPDPQLASQEQIGVKDGGKESLSYIDAGDNVPDEFPQQLTDFLDQVWQSAKANTAKPQKLLMGSHRGKPAVDILPDPYVSRLHNPAPIPPAQKPQQVQHLHGIAKDWSLMEDIDVVKAYTFRGETSFRAPQDVKARGGFHPPSTRNDDAYLNPPTGKVYLAFVDYMKRVHNQTINEQQYIAAIQQRSPRFKQLFHHYSLWRELLKAEELHLGRMLANELLKGYISTTKSVSVAKGFAGASGWVYCVLVRGGYHVPEKGESDWTSIFGEQEIAFPGSIPWKDVYAFRQVKMSKFTGPLWLRSGSGYWGPEKMKKVYKLLSGKIQ